MPMPSRRGRGASAEEDEAATAGTARGSPRCVAGTDPSRQMEKEMGENYEEEMQKIDVAKQLMDFLGAGKDDDDDVKAGSSSAADDDPSDGPVSPEDESFLVIPDDAIDGSATTADDAPDRRSGGFDFDLNQQPCSSDESEDDEAPEIAADSSPATAEDGSVEFVDGATVPPSGGFGFDLNQPCPSELMGSAADPSDAADPAPAPAEDRLAGLNVGEQPEFPDGGAPAVSRTRRRRRPWDWAFEWTNVLGLGPFGWKRSRR